jgi:hypothetical protein
LSEQYEEVAYLINKIDEIKKYDAGFVGGMVFVFGTHELIPYTKLTKINPNKFVLLSKVHKYYQYKDNMIKQTSAQINL